MSNRNVLHAIDFHSDEWVILSDDALYKLYFNFTFLPNKWFKNTLKEIIKDRLAAGNVKRKTLRNDLMSLKVFFEFLEETNQPLNTFEELNFDTINNFLFFLVLRFDKAGVRSRTFNSLKMFIQYGCTLEWDGFPKENIFGGKEHRMLQTEDVLKSQVIEESFMKMIDDAIRGKREINISPSGGKPHQIDVVLKKFEEVGKDVTINSLGDIANICGVSLVYFHNNPDVKEKALNTYFQRIAQDAINFKPKFKYNHQKVKFDEVTKMVNDALNSLLNRGRIITVTSVLAEAGIGGNPVIWAKKRPDLIEKVLLEQEQQGVYLQIRKVNDNDLFAYDLMICLVTILRFTGIRISELLLMTKDSLKENILLGETLLEVISEKNKTDRYIPVSREVIKAFKKLVTITEAGREALNTDRLFVVKMNTNTPGKESFWKEADYVTVRDWFKRYFLKPFRIFNQNGEIPKLHFHQFRHTLGTEMLNKGMSIFEIMDYLGHKSIHSTRLYAKVARPRFDKEYRKLGFIGVTVPRIDEAIQNLPNNQEKHKKLLNARLPDGICKRPIDEDVTNCKKPNACLFCPKYITTLEHLSVHKEHLAEIQADKVRYMEENLIATDYLLFETEKALKEIIERLEALSNG